MIRLARRLAGLLLFLAAARWAYLGVRRWLDAWRDLDAIVEVLRDGYPNEWGVRTEPLDRAATADALERERRLLLEQVEGDITP